MIISHKHKFIFIKPTKVAGTSIELLLSRFCGEDDIITPFIFEPNGDIRKNYEAKSPQNFEKFLSLKDYKLKDFKDLLINLNRKKEQIFSEHDSAEAIKNELGDKVWKSYYKVSIVRNPWDHLVSWYEWRRFRLSCNEGNSIESFKREIVKSQFQGTTIWEKISINQKIDLDFVIKFENLENDFLVLLKHLSLSLDCEIPSAKSGIRKEKKYQKYYDDFSREFVYRKNKQLIDCFNYTFD